MPKKVGIIQHMSLIWNSGIVNLESERLEEIVEKLKEKLYVKKAA